MEQEQFKELKESLEYLGSNTSWTWHNNNELENIKEKLESIEDLLDSNNALLQELIEVIKRR